MLYLFLNFFIIIIYINECIYAKYNGVFLHICGEEKKGTVMKVIVAFGVSLETLGVERENPTVGQYICDFILKGIDFAAVQNISFNWATVLSELCSIEKLTLCETCQTQASLAINVILWKLEQEMKSSVSIGDVIKFRDRQHRLLVLDPKFNLGYEAAFVQAKWFLDLKSFPGLDWPAHS